MINYNIGGLFTHDKFILSIIDKSFLKDKNISVYGGISCLWHSGRIIDKKISLEKINFIIEKYNSLNVGCNFIFSSYNIQKEDLEDTFCNDILFMLNKCSLNGVIISSDLLYDYIRSKYKNVSIISSIIKTSNEALKFNIESPEYYDNLCKKFDNVVINQSRSNDFEFLRKIKYKNKIEILINSKCKKFCELQHIHYNCISSIERNKSTNKDYSEQIILYNNIMQTCKQMKNNPDSICCSCSYNDILELIKIGFNNFKIEGREYNIDEFKYEIYKYLYGIINYQYMANENMYTCSFNNIDTHYWKGGKKYNIGFSVDNLYIESDNGIAIVPIHLINNSMFFDIFNINLLEVYNNIFI